MAMDGPQCVNNLTLTMVCNYWQFKYESYSDKERQIGNRFPWLMEKKIKDKEIMHINSEE